MQACCFIYFVFPMLQKKFGADYGHYRDSRVEGGKQVQGVSGSTQYYFSDNPLLANLETTAKS